MNISILGSTGSIGTQALEVVDDLKGIKDIAVLAITGNSNVELLEAQARRYKPSLAVIADEKKYNDLKCRLADTNIKVSTGEEGLCEAATLDKCDMVLSSIVGFAGLVPTMKAIEAGKDIALANKETLVTAGGLFTDAVKRHNVRLLPVDSEHSAIFQSLHGGNRGELNKILLTASGGPFFGKTKDELKGIKKEQALKHPNWSMGAKITIDSATLMNKGLEIIEAKWLFDVFLDDIEVVVHRESIIHSMVEFCDKSVIAQLSLPSMKHPIQYAFTYPERLPSPDRSVSFAELKALTFAKPDEETFRCLALAKKAGRMGGIMPTVLNAANEVAVAAFLCDKIGFLEIGEYVESVLSKYENKLNFTIEDIIEIDRSVRLEHKI
ncbi:MAG: 1-deoxy-D-xylulose-5-phosphate reductoisomerase [Ruminococcaceae bacterium]|nr:1-deoxy-D-xylulose-5-phosphate reductoisomerase [Oscillospiraceae bacterium]